MPAYKDEEVHLNTYQAVGNLFDLIKLILIVRILFTWFPNIDWWKQPFKFLHDFTEPILAPFRKIIPPIGGFDLSPIFAFMALSLVKNILLGIILR